MLGFASSIICSQLEHKPDVFRGKDLILDRTVIHLRQCYVRVLGTLFSNLLFFLISCR